MDSSVSSVNELQVRWWPLLTNYKPVGNPLLTNYKPVCDFCWRTTSPSTTSVDELQARRWLLLTNYKPVNDFCWRTTSPSMTAADELQVRRWPLLTNYKPVNDCCWRTTSPSVTFVELLVSGLLCWLDNMSELQAQAIGELLDMVTTLSNMSELQAQPNWSKLLLPTIQMLSIGQWYLKNLLWHQLTVGSNSCGY